MTIERRLARSGFTLTRDYPVAVDRVWTAFAQEDQLIAILKSDAPLIEKADACEELARVATLRCCRAGRFLGRQRGGVTNVHSAFLIDLGKHKRLPGCHWVSQMQMRQALCGASNVAEWHLGSGPSDAGSTTLARTRQFVTNG
mgnify:CR=1 FL=1